MERLILKAEIRDIIGKKVKSLRREGFIPAVVYGRDVESQSITIESREFSKILKQAGENTIIDLDIAGKKSEVIIYDVQLHPVSDKVIAIDFLVINRGQKITTNVELSFVGVAEWVKTDGGILLTPKNSLSISVLPKDLIQTVEVDISVLNKIGSLIHVEDVIVPNTIEVLDTPKEVVALIVSSRESKIVDSEEWLEVVAEDEVNDKEKEESK